MYLVTGAAGFIGFHLSLELLKKNKIVIGVDNINNYYNQKIKYDRLKFLKKFKKFKFIKLDLYKNQISAAGNKTLTESEMLKNCEELEI